MIEKNFIFFRRWSMVGSRWSGSGEWVIGKCGAVASKTNIFHSTPFQVGKVAGVDWTVGKLLNIILLVLVLVLVAYGISTQSLNPLIENVGGKFNEVLIMFNLKDDVAFGECYSENVVNLGGGRDFLKELDVDGEDVILNVCRNRICNISGEGLGDYRVNGGKFEKLENGEWGEYNSVFIGELSFVKSNWEMYNAGVGVLDEVENIDFLFFDKPTKKFVLYGDGSEVYAIWQNNNWIVSKGQKFENYEKGEHYDIVKRVLINEYGQEIVYEGRDSDVAIDMFAKIVRAGIDDKVYWKELEHNEEYDEKIDIGDKIGKLVSNIGFFSSFDELDDDKEVEQLRLEFAKKKAKYLDEVKPSENEVENLERAIENNREFAVSVEKTEEYFIIIFSSGDNRFGLKYDSHRKPKSDFDWETDKTVFLNSVPFVLVKWDGSKWKEIGNEEYYRLPENYFEEVKRATLISEFLKSKCK